MEKEDTYLPNESHSRPKLERLLRALSLDKQFVRGDQNTLFYYDSEGKEVAVSDFVGGYGSLLFGHHHPELKKLVIELIEAQVPMHSQLSSKSAVEVLSTFISDEIGRFSGKSYITTLANSGAEVVEAAIKHARLQFSDKKEKLALRLHRELQNINHYFVAGGRAFDLTIEERSFNNFESFKDFCIEQFHSVYNSKSPIMLALSQSFHGKTEGNAD